MVMLRTSADVVVCCLFGVLICMESRGTVTAVEPDPDSFLSVPDIISRRGYPVEVHHVVTEDGYILQLHRIVGRGRPVLILHGLMDSSASWVINPGRPLGFLLADFGYDVWLGNNRGNRYSRSHVHLSSQSKLFWQFTADSFAEFDNPSMINYIIENTGYSEIFYIGHSSSTWSFWAMMNHHPEMNSRVRLMVALGPVATMAYWSTVLRLLVPFRHLLYNWGSSLGIYEVGDHKHFYPKLAHMFCSELSPTNVLCGLALNLMAGWHPQQLDKTSFARIFSHIPAGDGYRVLLQFSQHVASGRFQHFDYGATGNLQVYGRPTPPPYYPEAVTVPVVLMWGENDKMADKRDVALLAARLPRLVSNHRIPAPGWQHLDFLWGIDADTLVYLPIVDYLRLFDAPANQLDGSGTTRRLASVNVTRSGPRSSAGHKQSAATCPHKNPACLSP